MMPELEERARARVKRAFWIGRLEIAALTLLPYFALSLLGWQLHDRSMAVLVVGALVGAAAGAGAFVGRGMDRAALAALGAGLPAFAAPLCASDELSLCAGAICLPDCLLACVGGGLLSGLLFAAFLRRSSAPGWLSGFGALLLFGVGTLGCVGAGAPGLVGLFVGSALGSAPNLRRALRSNP
jgi:hypothetical protein